MSMVRLTGSKDHHQKMYQQWFNYVDSDGDGRITSDEANKFFAISNIQNHQLKQVCAIADSKCQGFLGFKEFITAMQLLSLAQAGHELNADFLKTTFDAEIPEPPVMKGLDSLLVKHRGSRTNGASERNGILVVQHVPPKNVSPERNGILVVPPKNVFASKLSKKTSSKISVERHIADGLKSLYKEKLKPLEVASRYNDFASPLLTDGDFYPKPMVMLLGPCSSGKTTFIKHFLKCEYPGSYIGHGATTGSFFVVMDGPDKEKVNGNIITLTEGLPFNELIPFGKTFLSQFECSRMPHPLLERITFVDTPGVLLGKKKFIKIGYDISGVFKWFAEKSDLILLLFDPHQVGISEEFGLLLSSLHGQYEKMSVVLTQADQVDTQHLLRVYGKLMGLLGKYTPGVTRAYIGSFGDKPISEASVGFMGKDLFEKEQDELLKKLIGLPKEACIRRMNKFYDRAEAVRMHAHIINQLKKEMPAIALMGKSRAQKKLIKNLQYVFAKVQREFNLPAWDFPDVEHFRQLLGAYNLHKFEKVKTRMIQVVDDMLRFDMPNIYESLEVEANDDSSRRCLDLISQIP